MSEPRSDGGFHRGPGYLSERAASGSGSQAEQAGWESPALYRTAVHFVATDPESESA